MAKAIELDYLFVGPLIEQRLRERIADVPVDAIEQVAQIADDADVRPRLLFVMWGGDRFDITPGGRAANGASQAVHQRWVVWVRVRNASTADRDARNTAAGPLLSKVHAALAGWTPEGAVRTLMRAPGPAPDYKPASGLYPLTFEITLTL